MSGKGLDILHKSSCFDNDKLSCMPFCDSCVLRKQHKVQFPISPYPNRSKSTEILEYLHADVWGPAREPTQGYPKGVKGYRLCLRSEPSFKVVISRDVTFNESEFPCLSVPMPVHESDTAPSKVEQSPSLINYDDMHAETETLTGLHADSPDLPAENVDLIAENSDATTVHEVSIDNMPGNESLEGYQLARDKVRRNVVNRHSKLNDYHMDSFVCSVFDSIDSSEPKSYDDALKFVHSVEWLNAMNEEMNSFHVNNKWILVPKPDNCSVVDCKWLFKVKDECESIRFKARLVAKGFTQREGIDYTKIFTPVVKVTTIRIMFALCAQFNWELRQMDVKTAFLHGNLDEKIYMRQPNGFVDKSKSGHISYVEKILSKFFMSDDQPINVPLAGHFRHSKQQSPIHEEDIEYMRNVSYASAIGSVMYLMVSTRPDIAYSLSCLSMYMSDPAEYVAITEAIKEAIWIKGLLSEYHFIRDVVAKGIVLLEKNPSESNPADMGTKCLPVEKFESCLETLNLTLLIRLSIWIYSFVGRSLLFFTSLIKASPQLHEFRIKLIYIVECWCIKQTEIPYPAVSAAEAVKFDHKSLKMVEMGGYVGCSSERELLLQLFDIATSLERVVIDIESDYYDDPQLPTLLSLKEKMESRGRSLEIGATTRTESKERAHHMLSTLPP
ncbi:retrovirus-related pol polyprotein from transposon tnt 1-94 [Phtheirospermum japonicum]|uniref:Retrovirus-related pol polyprotein from transposon tnt 1-94 n=1 Tax=Phtheirospermum japonicum TaxID=374723 RepID=A0A830BH47_9LAMI|nr:retrovirus-related pol polyprotein from transposon tnt 1-94 [Phtheirospermum japonicum]